MLLTIIKMEGEEKVKIDNKYRSYCMTFISFFIVFVLVALSFFPAGNAMKALSSESKILVSNGDAPLSDTKQSYSELIPSGEIFYLNRIFVLITISFYIFTFLILIIYYFITFKRNAWVDLSYSLKILLVYIPFIFG